MGVGKRSRVASQRRENFVGAHKLSPRELQVGKGVWQAKSLSEIGEALGISAGTVGTHMYRAMTKLGLAKNIELALWYERKLVEQRARREK